MAEPKEVILNEAELTALAELKPVLDNHGLWDGLIALKTDIDSALQKCVDKKNEV